VRDPVNCPNEAAPGFDIAASPILVESAQGKPMLLVGQKSGVLYALDPLNQGATLWERRLGSGGTLGGIMWGPAADAKYVYAAISDAKQSGREMDPDVGGGLFAVELSDGDIKWKTPHPDCASRNPCGKVQAAAVSVTEGVVFSGSVDGYLRAYSAKDGDIIWEFNTAREFPTVNGVKARGGSINNGGVAIVDGMVFTNSGYSHHGGIMPGNVFLAFEVQ
jgi:polyvinyl alcohol dehydrogenase (cytochrome)